jgi:predicted metalloendopeptidase
MVKNLLAAYKNSIEHLDWMGPETRAKALEKLSKFTTKIGYPDRWRDYSALTLERGPFLVNRGRAAAFEIARQLGRVGQPVDRGEWRMTPPTVNAYYSGSNNDINFPAGILQPPFYDPEADDAVNYGSMGAVIGHEMTHGFDDRGRQFDADGNLRDWWTAEDARRYRERADRVVEQFNGYVAVDTVHVNGRLTLGENIADLGGLAVAYAAMQKALEGRPRVRIDGYTPEQRFFLAWARVWRSKYRPEAARLRAATDSHSPARWRVNGPLSNLPEFAKTFGCSSGDPMVRDAAVQVKIW